MCTTNSISVQRTQFVFTLNAPSWLWLLLIVPAYLFYLLFIQSTQRKSFPSLLLWKQLKQNLDQSDSPFPSLHYILTAVLLSLLLSGIIVALARPILPSLSQNTSQLRIFIDMTASMNIQNEQGETRFRRALQKLHELNDAENIPNQWTVTQLTHPVSSRSGTPDELLEFLSKQQSSHLSFSRNFEDQLRDLLKNETKPTLLITDSPRLDDTLFDKNTQRWVVGEPRSNTGIISLRATKTGSTLRVATDIRHYGPSNRNVHVELQTANGDTLQSRQVPLSTDRTNSVFLTFKDWQHSTGKIRIYPGNDDALSADNTAYFAVTDPYRLRTRYEGPDNRHIRHVLSALEWIHPVSDAPDVTFYYKPSEETARSIWKNPPSPALVISPSTNKEVPFSTMQLMEQTRLRPARHPIVQNLMLEHVRVNRPRVLTESDSAPPVQEVLMAGKHPTTFIKQTPGPQLWMLFDPFIQSKRVAQTYWSIHPDTYPEFIQFWQNTMQYVHPLNLSQHGDIVYWKTGDPIRSPQRASPSSSSSDQLHTVQTGIHSMDTAGRAWPIPVNLNSASETNTLVKNRDQNRPISFTPIGKERTDQPIHHRIQSVLLLLFLFTLILISFLHRTPPSR